MTAKQSEAEQTRAEQSMDRQTIGRDRHKSIVAKTNTAPAQGKQKNLQAAAAPAQCVIHE